MRERLGAELPGAPDADEPPTPRRRLFGGRRVDAEDAELYSGPERRRADRRQEDLDDEQRPVFRRPRNR